MRAEKDMTEQDENGRLTQACRETGQPEGVHLEQSAAPEQAEAAEAHEGKKRFLRWTDKSIRICVAGAVFFTLSILVLFIAGEIKGALLALVLSFILFFYTFLKQTIRDILADSASKKESDWSGLHVYAGLDVMESMKFLFMGLLTFLVSAGLCVFRFFGH